MLVAVGIALVAAQPAAAQVIGGCHATLNDVNLDILPLGDSDAVEVGKDDFPPMTMTAPSGKRFSNLRISLVFLGSSWDVYNESASGGTWSHNVDVHSFATYGVGLYDLRGTGKFVGGGGCVGEAFVNVTGNPFSTVAGIAGTAAAGVGVLSVLGAGMAAGGGGGGSGPGGSYTQQDAAKAEERERENKEFEEGVDAATGGGPLGWCFLGALLPIALVPLLLLFGTNALMMAVVAPAVQVRRKRWPFVVGPIGGLLTGLGAGVLLQEYAVVYPTRTWGIIYLAGGIAFGLAVPMLRRTLSR